MQPILLDTCAIIWLASAEPLGRAATEMLNETRDAGTPSYVSPISAWEIGNLVSRGRLRLLATPERWFERLFEAQNLRLAGMPPALLIASSFLPGKPPRDPADRLLAATARDLGATLVTRDRLLLDYGSQGHISTMAC
jgi:PIN domain nuclease of toxin-antitoxin system